MNESKQSISEVNNRVSQLEEIVLQLREGLERNAKV
jgi:hypothetical protein